MEARDRETKALEKNAPEKTLEKEKILSYKGKEHNRLLIGCRPSLVSTFMKQNALELYSKTSLFIFVP